MPRPTESQEAKILRWFRTAPLAAAGLLLGLVKDAVREREVGASGGVHHREAVTRPKSAVAAPKKKSHHKVAAAEGGKNWTSPHTRSKPPAAGGSGKGKRSHHKRARPTNGSEGAEVESFDTQG